MPNPIHIELQRAFPSLANFRITSVETVQYNCIAWSMGFNDKWWSPAANISGNNHYWEGRGCDNSLETFLEMYALNQYEQCNSYTEIDTVVVLYGTGTCVTHASCKPANQKWLAKMGTGVDIEYLSPEELEGSRYGNILCYLKFIG